MRPADFDFVTFAGAGVFVLFALSEPADFGFVVFVGAGVFDFVVVGAVDLVRALVDVGGLVGLGGAVEVGCALVVALGLLARCEPVVEVADAESVAEADRGPVVGVVRGPGAVVVGSG